ncbi:MAG TPA: TIGR04086 family membrane protein [Ruminococcaceae bacterium]|nr:TIGR04086 family membrane protein [Oscillospiraceae bacterium]HCT16540.1 TIGR04086 family membrane protein [Oscillospiraceae bacterium]
MPKSKRKSSAKESPALLQTAIKTLIGSLVNIIIYFALTAVFSLISLKTDAKSDYFRYMIFFISAMSGLVGGFAAVKPIRKNGILIGAVSAAPAFLIIFLVSSIISRTGISITGWVAAAIMTLFSAIGGIISANKR